MLPDDMRVSRHSEGNATVSSGVVNSADHPSQMPDAKQQVQCGDETSGHGYPHNSKAFTGVERAEAEEINITQPEVAVLQDPSPDWREESIPAAVTTPAEERPSAVPQLS